MLITLHDERIMILLLLPPYYVKKLDTTKGPCTFTTSAPPMGYTKIIQDQLANCIFSFGFFETQLSPHPFFVFLYFLLQPNKFTHSYCQRKQ